MSEARWRGRVVALRGLRVGAFAVQRLLDTYYPIELERIGVTREELTEALHWLRWAEKLIANGERLDGALS